MKTTKTMKRILSTLLIFCLGLALMPARAAEGGAPSALEKVPDALAGARTLDEQLALLDDAALRFGDTLEYGGWDLNLNAPLAEGLPECFLPETFENVVSVEELPQELRGVKLLALYDDKGTMRLLGDAAARLPQGMCARSLSEAEGVLLLRHYLVARSDYIGSAYNRFYELCAWKTGSREIYRLFMEETTPPLSGRGTLSGEVIAMASLWEGFRNVLLPDTLTLQDAYGTLTFRVTGKTCYLERVTGDRATLEVPAEVGGFPVAGIADCDLDTVCPSLTEARLSESIAWIGENAFFACRKLQTISFPSTLRTIGEDAFRGCEAITALDLPEGLETVGDQAIAGWPALERVTLPSTLKSMGSCFLIYGGACPWVVVPEGITKLEFRFLAWSNQTLCVYLPASVTTFEDNVLSQSIAIYTPQGSAAARWAEMVGYGYTPCARPEDMPRPQPAAIQGDFQYAVLEGEAVLMEYLGEDAEVIIPAELGGYPVGEIHHYAFYRQEFIRSITFPPRVTRIQYWAIYECGTLEVYMPASLQKIDNKWIDSPGDVVVHAPQGSAAQRWAEDRAEKYGTRWEPWEP